MKWAYLYRRSAGDGGLAPPLERLVQVSDFQHPKAAHLLLGVEVWPVGHENFAIGLRPQRPRAAWGVQAANENPDTSDLHLVVERVE